MEVRDFDKGQQVFVLNMYEGRNKEPTITPVIIDKIGRRYVTTVRGRRYETQEWFDFGLVEAVDYGERAFLCPSESDAKAYIEKCVLVLWIRNLRLGARDSKYTLDQLREVKRILTE